ncbi:MAG: ATP-binding protein [Candidatus Aminicenantes bacterium]|nr:ATP-binding protein [Candidatus Aminicenantes bacterium]
MLEELFDLSQRFIRNYHRDFQRYFLKKYALENRFSIIIGPKGVGKTTVIIQYLLKFAAGDRLSKDIIYIQADHFVVGKHSLYEIADRFVKEGGKLICFDEIHKYSDWSKELKSINDTFPALKIIASGSSALEIHKGSHDLSRRAIVYYMHTMSFREFLRFVFPGLELDNYKLEEILTKHREIADAIIEKIEKKEAKILPLFKRYLEYGCYPYFKEFADKDLFHVTLEQNIHTTVENDLISVFPGLNGTGIKKIKKLIAYIAEAVPFTPDLRNIKRLLEIGDERTLKNYLQYLENGGIILSVCKRGKSLRVLEKPEKIFLHNTNLMYAIGSKENLQKGSIRENFFLNTLSAAYRVNTTDRGDFLVDGKTTFEVGGKGKSFKQIKGVENSFLALDDIETGIGGKIPLWLFGFLY